MGGRAKNKEIIKWLYRYMYLQFEIERHEERIARLKSAEEFPARPEGSEGGGSSQPNKDRMGSAIVRRMLQEERVRQRIAEINAELDEIEDAIDQLQNPLEREVLRLRYLDGEDNRDNEDDPDSARNPVKHMEWKDISLRIYGDNDEKHLRATYRLHGLALENISKIRNEVTSNGESEF